MAGAPLDAARSGPVPGGWRELDGERGAAASDPGPHGAGRDLEHLGDLGVVEVAEVPQDDRDPELLRDPGEGRVDVDPVAGRLGAVAAGRGRGGLGERSRSGWGAGRRRRSSSSAAFVATR